ncbi:MAG TPA: zinc ribbon domain-containing protein [Blastocatellia bacterium]|jgi:hypothetical protein
MFCPKCGTRNLVEQKYCRGCGHHLAGHRAALEGRYDDATSDLKKGSALVSIGLVVGGICKLNILANWFLGADNIGAIINTLVALLVAVPLITIGVIRLGWARRVLSPKDQAGDESAGKSKQATGQLPAAPAADHPFPPLVIPASVTEHTTLELVAPEQARKEPSPARQADAIRS